MSRRKKGTQMEVLQKIIQDYPARRFSLDTARYKVLNILKTIITGNKIGKEKG